MRRPVSVGRLAGLAATAATAACVGLLLAACASGRPSGEGRAEGPCRAQGPCGQYADDAVHDGRPAVLGSYGIWLNLVGGTHD